MKMYVDEGAQYIIKKLEENGFEAFVVGGCVRDSLMGKTPDDWDITTDARCEDVEKIFERTVPTGIKHGTITVIYKNINYEVTTYRVDGRYENHRRPESVVFSENILDDLSRRDFTINAMAYNEKSGLIDEFGGYEDIKRKIIRCVGVPDFRFDEDALRIMRAVRFSAKLGFSIEENTLESIYKKADNLRYISRERINSELEKTIFSDVKKLSLLKKIGLFDWLIKGVRIDDERLELAYKVDEYVDKYKTQLDKRYLNKSKEEQEKFDVDKYSVYKENLVKNTGAKDNANTNEVAGYGIDEKRDTGFLQFVRIEANTDIKKAIIFKEIIDEGFVELLNDLRYSKKSINTSLKIKKILNDERYINIYLLDDEVELRKTIKWILRKVGDEFIAKSSIFSLFIEKNANPSLCLKVFDDIIESGECFSISSLKINGRDIVSKKIAKGRGVGQILEKLLDLCIENPKLNERDRLINLAIKISKNDMEE